jgi:hypothetical protein
MTRVGSQGHRKKTNRHNVESDYKPDDGNQYSHRNIITAKQPANDITVLLTVIHCRGQLLKFV